MGTEWRLVLEQLVYSSSHLLRPRRSEVRGEHAILQKLRSLGDGELLLREAERLFRSPPSSDVAYIAQDSSWVPDVQEQVLEAGEDGGDEGHESQLERAKEQLSRAGKRIAALEATVRTLQEALKAAAATAVARPAAQPERVAGTQAGEAVLSEAVERAEADEHEESSKPAAVRIAEPEVKPAAGAVELPSVGAVGELLRELGGGGATVFPIDDASWMQGDDAYWCPLTSDEGDERAAIVFDFECAVRLAGALLMESPENIEVILTERTMSADMVDAASEVGNTVASVFNKVKGNRHLRATKLNPVDDDARAFIGTAGERQCYRYGPGGLLGLCTR